MLKHLKITLSIMFWLAACTTSPVTPMVTLSPIPPVTVWTATFTPTIAVADMNNAPREEVVKALFTQYLSHYQAAQADDRHRLDSYEVLTIDLSPRRTAIVDSGAFDFVAAVTFSVKPSVFRDSTWVAGSGEIGNDGWIRNGGIFVGVITRDGEYQLQILGSG